MQELRKAMGEGVRATLHSASRLPKRHPFAIAGLALAMALILLGAGVYDAQQQISVQKKQITKFVTATSVCDEHSIEHPKRSLECAERLRLALLNCRLHPACQRAFKLADTPPPEPKATGQTGAKPEGGGSQQPGKSPPGQQPGGGAPATKPPGHQPGQKNPPKSHQPAEPAPESGSPPGNQGGGEQGGNSGGQGQGEGQGQGQGQSQGQGVEVELCVENPLLPACVNAGVSGLE